MQGGNEEGGGSNNRAAASEDKTRAGESATHTHATHTTTRVHRGAEQRHMGRDAGHRREVKGRRARVPSQLGPHHLPNPVPHSSAPPSWCPLHHTRHSPPQAHKNKRCVRVTVHTHVHKRTRVKPRVVGPGGVGGSGENPGEHQAATPLLSTREHTAGLKAGESCSEEPTDASPRHPLAHTQEPPHPRNTPSAQARVRGTARG